MSVTIHTDHVRGKLTVGHFKIAFYWRDLRVNTNIGLNERQKSFIYENALLETSRPSASSVSGIQWNANTILWPCGFSESPITFESIDFLSNPIKPYSVVSFVSRSLLFDIKDIFHFLQRMYTSGSARTLCPVWHFYFFFCLTIFDPVLSVPRKSGLKTLLKLTFLIFFGSYIVF